MPPPAVVNAVRALIYADARSMYGQHHYKKPQRGNAQRLLYLKVGGASGGGGEGGPSEWCDMRILPSLR